MRFLLKIVTFAMQKKNNELTIKTGQMIYTNQRRRELNKALFSKF